jgi:L-lactate dehydrogenase complex protein LldF
MNPPVYRSGLRLWSWLARRPALYHAVIGGAGRVLGWAGKTHGRFRSLPLASGWTLVRDMPAPEGRTFHELWAERERGHGARR